MRVLSGLERKIIIISGTQIHCFVSISRCSRLTGPKKSINGEVILLLGKSQPTVYVGNDTRI